MRPFIISIILFLFFLSTNIIAIDDEFLKGYIWAVLERELHIIPDDISVRGGRVIIQGDLDTSEREEIRSTLSEIKGVTSVEFRSGYIKIKKETTDYSETGKHISINRSIFRPLLADLFWPHFSISYQSYINDRLLGDVMAATIGETIPLYTDYYEPIGQWQVSIYGIVSTINDLDTPSWDLTNADFRFGMGIAQKREKFSSVFRFYHMSSHAGDEYVLNNNVGRINLSYEAFNLLGSYDLSDWIRIYGGGTYRFSTIPDDLKPWSVQYGAEFKSPWSYLDIIRFICGIDIKNKQETDWDSELSIRVGIRIEETLALWRKIEFVIGYYTGPSPHGQFYKKSHEYLEIGAHLYF